VTVAERRKSQLNHASLTIVPAGHWLQIDDPQRVATAVLSTAGK
jgi:haloalkane dehalogenase